ncbi:MAG: hypothetical protein RQ714_07975 [Nitrosomonas sp.]|nr:hypothetical protein [Nitrosomonas sp.]
MFILKHTNGCLLNNLGALCQVIIEWFAQQLPDVDQGVQVP